LFFFCPILLETTWGRRQCATGVALKLQLVLFLISDGTLISEQFQPDATPRLQFSKMVALWRSLVRGATAARLGSARQYRAVVCSQLLPPPPFKPGALPVKDLPSLLAKKGEVVLDVKAAAVNFPDLLIVQGKYQFKPEGDFSPGSEVAGIVKAVGEGVQGIKPGDHAIGSVPFGGYAQECAVPAQRVIPIPKGVPFPEAASVLMAYGTSHYALVDRAVLSLYFRVSTIIIKSNVLKKRGESMYC